MPSWPLYRLAFQPTSKERKECNPVPFPENENERIAFMSEIFRELAEANFKRALKQTGEDEAILIHESLACVGAVAERDWLAAGRPVIFAESSELVEKLWNCNYALDFDGICLPGEVLSFSFPDDAEIEGFKLPPCIFHRTDISAEHSPSGKEYTNYSIIVRGEYGQYEVASIAKQEHLDKVLKGELTPNLGVGEENLNDKEARRMAILCRIIIALSAYISAFPEAMRPGFPTMKERLLKPLQSVLVRACPIVLTQVQKFREVLVGGFRSAHFKTLRDPRFKRNPDGSYKSLFIETYFAGGKSVDPSTVEDIQGNQK